jgi:hypothetical protein
VAAGGRSGADFALVAALASGATVQDAATSSGVSERTVFRRLQDAEFRARLAAARGEMVSRALGLLADGSAAAAGKLLALMADAEVTPSVRLRAAVAGRALGHRLRESTEIDERLRVLEDRILPGLRSVR